MTQAMKSRPVSPHLQIYRFTPTMAMSIAHRITGVALFFGTVLVAWWLVAAASGPGYFATVNNFFGSIIGQIILFCYTWALVHHMLGGIRHLSWDTLHGIGKDQSTKLARANLAGSIVLTIVIWIIGYLIR